MFLSINSSEGLTNPLIIVLFVWSMIWKGLVLWKTARKERKFWFIFFLVVNTVGIAEIIYLVIDKLKSSKKIK